METAKELDAALRLRKLEKRRKLSAQVRGRGFLGGQPQLMIQLPLLALLFSRLFATDASFSTILISIAIATSVVHEAFIRHRLDALVALLELDGPLGERPEPNGDASSPTSS